MAQIESTGFGGVICLGHIQLDHSLITALVERWRSETHTFHCPTGEAIVTLQDVQVLLGLNVEGDVVSETDTKTNRRMTSVLLDLKGVTLEANSIKKGQILLSTLHEKMGLAYNASGASSESSPLSSTTSLSSSLYCDLLSSECSKPPLSSSQSYVLLLGKGNGTFEGLIVHGVD